MVQYTEWRSISDGSIISDIPDPDVYLQDDWGDNKLTDRDNSGTTTHNGEEGVYRPEWAVDSDVVSVTNESLHAEEGGQVRTEINLNLDETITWKWNDVDISNAGSSANHSLQVWSEATDWDFFTNGMTPGYIIEYSTSDSGRVRLWESDGTDSNQLTEEIGVGTNIDIEVKRDSDGGWEVSVDGGEPETATDTTYSDPRYIGFGSRDQGNSEDIRVDEVKVF